MQDYTLKNIDSEDISDWLVEVQKSFCIQFEGNELAGIETFGALCDHITQKITLDDVDDCTSQQAFYRLRGAISSVLEVHKAEILRDSPLEALLPKKTRRANVKKIERELGFKLNLLSPSMWVILFLAITAILSLLAFFISWKIALSGISFSILGFWLADLTANHFNEHTIEEVVAQMTWKQYVKSRRDKRTFNKQEVARVLTDWFSYEFGFDEGMIKRDFRFSW